MNRIKLSILALLFCTGMYGVAASRETPAAKPQDSKPVVAEPASQAAAKQPLPPASGGPLKPSEVKNFNDWTVRCFPVQTAAPCDVFQMVVKKDTKQRVLNVSIAYSPRENAYVAQFVVPWGLDLLKGLTIEAGKYSARGLPFRRCSLEGCYVEGRLDTATVNALSHTLPKAVLKITSYEGKAIDLPLSLNGFSPALEAMKANARAKMQ